MENNSSAELDVLVEATNHPGESWRKGTTGRFLVRANEASLLTTLLPRKSLPPDHSHVQRLGRLFAYPWGHHYHWSAIDPGNLLEVSVRIEWHDAEAGQTIFLRYPQGSGDYSIEPNLLDDFSLPMVDEFGQATWLDWPGKVQAVDELTVDGRRDLATAAHQSIPPPGRSRFGGFLAGPKLTATGFFRVEKVEGKWWFVDPEGYLFWSIGVNGASSGDPTRVQGREALFPEKWRTHSEVVIYEENLRLKYGSKDWSEKHTGLTVARLWDWGFNTAGGWSPRSILRTQRLPYTLIVHTTTWQLPQVRNLPDPFSEEFVQSVNHSLAKLAAEFTSPWLLGIFIDNELNWRSGVDLGEAFLQSSPETPARVALLEFIQQRYPTIDQLNKAWATSFTDFSSIQPRQREDAPPAYLETFDAFLERFADQYFSVCRQAMDRHFPGFLYLGCRFHVNNRIVRSVASRYCDVISLNIYLHRIEGYSMQTEVDRPWLISEFHFGQREQGNLGAGLTWAADARNQADLVQAYLSEALRNPNLVGAHWFQWVDQAVTGRFDGENFGVGLVTLTDRPVTTLTSAFQAVSAALPEYRLGHPTGRIGGTNSQTHPPGKNSSQGGPDK